VLTGVLTGLGKGKAAIATIFVFSMFFVLTSGCGSKAALTPTSVPSSTSIKVTDDLGKTIELKGAAQRIISLAPSNTEILFALGLGDKVVGVTEFCDFPPEAKLKEKIGGFSNPDMEKIIALSPDLVLAGNIHEDTVTPALERRGLKVLTIDPKTSDQVLQDILMVGEVTGAGERASRLVAEMKKRIEQVIVKTESLPAGQRPRVLCLTWHNPIYAAGSETLANELIQKAGGTNIAQDLKRYEIISLEIVIERNPQVIIAQTGHGEAKSLPFEWAKTEPKLKDTDARVNSRVYQVDTDLVGRPGPRLVDALERLAELIHPKIFGE
jgi:iron complex transport system substrate-binding protein